MNFIKKIFLLSLISSIPILSHGQCDNGGLENGNFSNWKSYTGKYITSRRKINKMKPGFLINQHEIIGPSIDWYSKISTVIEGSAALKLGSDIGAGKTQMASYTFKVTNQNKYFKFQYAMVITDYGHNKNEQPYFSYHVTKKGRKTPNAWSYKQMKLYNKTYSQKVADKNNAFFKPTPFTINTGADVIYRDWTCVNLDLSKYVGEDLTIHFISSDCEPGPDWGYAYVDALCENSTSVPEFTLPNSSCKNKDIMLDASATTNEDSYMISDQESDVTWGTF